MSRAGPWSSTRSEAGRSASTPPPERERPADERPQQPEPMLLSHVQAVTFMGGPAEPTTRIRQVMPGLLWVDLNGFIYPRLERRLGVPPDRRLVWPNLNTLRRVCATLGIEYGEDELGTNSPAATLSTEEQNASLRSLFCLRCGDELHGGPAASGTAAENETHDINTAPHDPTHHDTFTDNETNDTELITTVPHDEALSGALVSDEIHDTDQSDTAPQHDLLGSHGASGSNETLNSEPADQVTHNLPAAAAKTLNINTIAVNLPAVDFMAGDAETDSEFTDRVSHDVAAQDEFWSGDAETQSTSMVAHDLPADAAGDAETDSEFTDPPVSHDVAAQDFWSGNAETHSMVSHDLPADDASAGDNTHLPDRVVGDDESHIGDLTAFALLQSAEQVTYPSPVCSENLSSNTAPSVYDTQPKQLASFEKFGTNSGSSTPTITSVRPSTRDHRTSERDKGDSRSTKDPKPSRSRTSPSCERSRYRSKSRGRERSRTRRSSPVRGTSFHSHYSARPSTRYSRADRYEQQRDRVTSRHDRHTRSPVHGRTTRQRDRSCSPRHENPKQRSSRHRSRRSTRRDSTTRSRHSSSRRKYYDSSDESSKTKTPTSKTYHVSASSAESRRAPVQGSSLSDAHVISWIPIGTAAPQASEKCETERPSPWQESAAAPSPEQVATSVPPSDEDCQSLRAASSEQETDLILQSDAAEGQGEIFEWAVLDGVYMDTDKDLYENPTHEQLVSRDQLNTTNEADHSDVSVDSTESSVSLPPIPGEEDVMLPPRTLDTPPQTPARDAPEQNERSESVMSVLQELKDTQPMQITEPTGQERKSPTQHVEVIPESAGQKQQVSRIDAQNQSTATTAEPMETVTNPTLREAGTSPPLLSLYLVSQYGTDSEDDSWVKESPTEPCVLAGLPELASSSEAPATPGRDRHAEDLDHHMNPPAPPEGSLNSRDAVSEAAVSTDPEAPHVEESAAVLDVGLNISEQAPQSSSTPVTETCDSEQQTTTTLDAETGPLEEQCNNTRAEASTSGEPTNTSTAEINTRGEQPADLVEVAALSLQEEAELPSPQSATATESGGEVPREAQESAGPSISDTPVSNPPIVTSSEMYANLLTRLGVEVSLQAQESAGPSISNVSKPTPDEEYCEQYVKFLRMLGGEELPCAQESAEPYISVTAVYEPPPEEYWEEYEIFQRLISGEVPTSDQESAVLGMLGGVEPLISIAYHAKPPATLQLLQKQVLQMPQMPSEEQEDAGVSISEPVSQPSAENTSKGLVGGEEVQTEQHDDAVLSSPKPAAAAAAAAEVSEKHGSEVEAVVENQQDAGISKDVGPSSSKHPPKLSVEEVPGKSGEVKGAKKKDHAKPSSSKVRRSKSAAVEETSKKGGGVEVPSEKQDDGPSTSSKSRHSKPAASDVGETSKKRGGVEVPSEKQDDGPSTSSKSRHSKPAAAAVKETSKKRGEVEVPSEKQDDGPSTRSKSRHSKPAAVEKSTTKSGGVEVPSKKNPLHQVAKGSSRLGRSASCESVLAASGIRSVHGRYFQAPPEKKSVAPSKPKESTEKKSVEGRKPLTRSSTKSSGSSVQEQTASPAVAKQKGMKPRIAPKTSTRISASCSSAKSVSLPPSRQLVPTPTEPGKRKTGKTAATKNLKKDKPPEPSNKKPQKTKSQDVAVLSVSHPSDNGDGPSLPFSKHAWGNFTIARKQDSSGPSTTDVDYKSPLQSVASEIKQPTYKESARLDEGSRRQSRSSRRSSRFSTRSGASRAHAGSESPRCSDEHRAKGSHNKPSGSTRKHKSPLHALAHELLQSKGRSTSRDSVRSLPADFRAPDQWRKGSGSAAQPHSDVPSVHPRDESRTKRNHSPSPCPGPKKVRPSSNASGPEKEGKVAADVAKSPGSKMSATSHGADDLPMSVSTPLQIMARETPDSEEPVLPVDTSPHENLLGKIMHTSLVSNIPEIPVQTLKENNEDKTPRQENQVDSEGECQRQEEVVHDQADVEKELLECSAILEVVKQMEVELATTSPRQEEMLAVQGQEENSSAPVLPGGTRNQEDEAALEEEAVCLVNNLDGAQSMGDNETRTTIAETGRSLLTTEERQQDTPLTMDEILQYPANLVVANVTEGQVSVPDPAPRSPQWFENLELNDLIYNNLEDPGLLVELPNWVNEPQDCIMDPGVAAELGPTPPIQFNYQGVPLLGNYENDSVVHPTDSLEDYGSGDLDGEHSQF